MKQTLYDVLGVTPDASFEDIQFAYEKRFEKLRVETTFDSNRLVMLSEAREVLTNPERRAAYDATLNAASQQVVQPEPVLVHEDEPRSYGKWIVAGLVVAALVVWWLMRDGAPPDENAGETVIPGQQQSNAATDETSASAVDEDIDDEDYFDDEPLQPEPVAPAAPQSAPATAVAQSTATTSTAAETVVASPIVGNWQCFDPVTGRNSQYGFGADGQLSIIQAGGDARTVTYEIAGTEIKLTDAEPPRSMVIEGLTQEKLVLNTQGEGRRQVCSR